MLTFTACLVALLVLLVTVWAWRRWRYLHALRDAGVPGPPPGFFGGNVMQFRYGPKPCHLVVDDWLKQYGDIFCYHMGLHRYVVVKDLDLLQKVFISDFKRFMDRPPPSISTEDFRNSVLQVDAHRWKPMRSLLLSCFTASKMRQMQPLVRGCIDTTIEVVNEAVSKGENVDVHALFQALTCDVIAACALALKANCQRDASDPFLHRVRFFMDHASNPITESAFAFPVIAQVFGLILKAFALSEQMIQMINDNVDEVIRRRRQDKQTRHWDILQAMLDASEQNSEDVSANSGSANAKDASDVKEGNISSSKVQLTDQEIKSNALVTVLAGYETTANALTVTTFLLAKHPDVQERVYQEILDILPANEELSYDQLAGLPYLEMVLCEALRLYPPVVTFVSRQASEPTELGPYTVPAGTNVLAPVWSIHRDPEIWPEPDAFDPERFTKERSAGRHPMAWLPFGAGPRYCLGKRFGMLESKMALVGLVRHFRMELPEGARREMEFVVPTVTLCSKGAVRVKFIPR